MSNEKKTFQVVIQDNKTGKTLYYSADTKSSYFLPYKESATNFANVEDLEKELPFIKGICSTFYKNSRYGEIKILETIAIAYEIEHELTKLPSLEKESKPREQLGVETIDNSKNGLLIPNNEKMRPILFRGKRVHCDTLPKDRWWVEGDVSFHKTGKVFIKERNGSALNSYEIDPNTLSQYVCQDIENNPIFENSIIEQLFENGERLVGSIFYSEKHGGFVGRSIGGCVYNINFDSDKLRVIGNVFDDKHILEEYKNEVLKNTIANAISNPEPSFSTSTMMNGLEEEYER